MIMMKTLIIMMTMIMITMTMIVMKMKIMITIMTTIVISMTTMNPFHQKAVVRQGKIREADLMEETITHRSSALQV